ncbi:MAG: T9SS type A sorting domain-containing protein [Bacteroidota bacterium]
MRDIFRQADNLYDLGRFDNDGPDHIPNSGDDDGYVDMVFFWFLNYSSKGRYPLELDGNFTSTDVSWGPGHVARGFITVDPWRGCENRKDLRDLALGIQDWLAPTFHEGGHAIDQFPDMEHIGLINYDHYALGSFEVMSNGGARYPLITYPGLYAILPGFGGSPSLYNPWFRAERNWTAYTDITADSPNLILTDFDSTGQVLRFSPSTMPPEAYGTNKFLITYHKPSSANQWAANWPVDRNKGGVLVWQVRGTSVGLGDAWDYSNRNFLPITVRAAHGEYVWSGTTNTGVADPLSGLDSVLIRTLGSNGWPNWWPYYGSTLGMATQSVFFTPDAGKDFAFYSNPSTNLYSTSGENYARNVTSGLSMKNLRTSGGVTYADFKVGDYIVSQNATLTRGIWHIKNSITVQSGVTLTIAAGATLKFDAGKGLTVYGRLVANGSGSLPIVFTASSTTWAGVSIGGSGANNSSLQYVTIQNVQTYGGSALNISATGVQVQNCTISNNVNYGTQGLYFSNAGTPDVSYNMFTGNGGSAVTFYNTNGYFYKNTVSGSNGGVNCNYYASPSFGKLYFPAYNGNNVITTGSGGVYATAYSSPLIGSQSSTYYGYNSIVPTSGYRVSANNNCFPLAEQNWWGSSSPSSSWFYAANNSSIDWNPYLTYNPNPSVKEQKGKFVAQTQGLADSVSTLVPDAALQSAIVSRASGDFAGAKSQLHSLALACKNQSYARLVAQELMNLHRETNDGDLYSTALALNNSFAAADPATLTILANMLYDEGNRAAAATLYDQVARENPGTLFEKGALLGEFYLHFGNQAELSQARTVVEQLKKSYSQDPDVLEAAWVAGVATEIAPQAQLGSQEVANSTNAASGYELSANYPNPFNPSTQIRFTLPEAADVSLAVFDVVGRQVASLASGHFEAGFHTYVWDASKLASGVYFARVRVTDDQGKLKFNKINKLLLTK